MSHAVREKPWGTIDLDLHAPRVFFQQKWHYNWTAAPGVAPWTVTERRRFHHRLDRQIWSRWSNRIRLRVTGSGDFFRRVHGAVPINFDVKWQLGPGHWTVNVRKLPADSNPTTFISNVVFATRTINLDSADLAAYTPSNAAGVAGPGFLAVPHEFAHTLGAPDEYVAGSPHLADSTSIANVGRQVRGRHLALILTELNTMVPGCTFAYP